MKNVTKIFMEVLFFASITQAGWIVQNSGTTFNLKDVAFVNAQYGWAVGGEWYVQSDAVILSTSNGGNTWVNRTPGNIRNGIDGLSGVSFVNTQTGWAVGVDTFRCSLIIKTTDGGATWSRQTAPIDTPSPVSVHFVDANNGWTSPGGPHGPSFEQVIFHTTNGGNAWSVQSWDNYDGGSCRVFFADLTHGFVAAGTEMTPTTRGYIMRTTDGGGTWGESYRWGATIPFTWPLMTGVHFPLDDLNGWGCGWLVAGPTDYRMRVVRTTNGGNNWASQLYTNSFTPPWDIHFIDLQNGWVVCDSGVILHTTNGGSNWYVDASGVTNNLNAVDFVNIGDGWAVGSGGTILKYAGTGVIETATATELVNGIQLDVSNPVFRTLILSFTLSESEVVRIGVYNTMGRKVKTIFEGPVEKGSHNLKTALNIPAGVYFLRLRTRRQEIVNKLAVIK